MEVHLSPELEKQITELSSQSGRATDDLVEDAMAGYLTELREVRNTLDSRYEDLKTGNVKPIQGDEVEAHVRNKSATARRRPAD